MQLSLFILLAFLGNTSCTKKLDPKDTTLTFNVRERIRSLDPIVSNDQYSTLMTGQIFEGLLHYHYLKRPLQLEPLLAEALPEISADGLKYTFKIKKGVLFHNSPAFANGQGRELIAEDFIYSWKRLVDPKYNSENYWLVRNHIVGLEKWREDMRQGQADYTTPVPGLTAIDSHTLVITLTEPYYQFLYALTQPAMSVVPHEAIQLYGKEFTNHPVGTGAFYFDNWIRNSRLTLKKNPQYHEMKYPQEGTEADTANGFLADAGTRLPLIDRVVVYEMPEEQPQHLTFMKGDLDYWLITKDYQPEFISSGSLKDKYTQLGMSLALVTLTDITYVSFNNENNFLKNKKVRQALALAYDNATSFKKFYNSLALVAHGPLPPTVEGYRPDLKNPYLAHNIEKAKALLAEAGYKNGEGLPEFQYDMSATHTTARQMAEFLKYQAAAIGVRLNIQGNTWTQFSEKIKKKQSDIYELAWNGDYPDAENFLQLFYSKNISPGPNNANFKNEKFDSLYVASKKLPPGPARTRLYEQMEDVLIEETPWIFNMHRTRACIRHSWLKNFKYEEMIKDTFKYYRIDGRERAERKRKL